jgi:hypothetical protein
MSNVHTLIFVNIFSYVIYTHTNTRKQKQVFSILEP